MREPVMAAMRGMAAAMRGWLGMGDKSEATYPGEDVHLHEGVDEGVEERFVDLVAVGHVVVRVDAHAVLDLCLAVCPFVNKVRGEPPHEQAREDTKRGYIAEHT